MFCLSKVAICFPKTTVLEFVWCRAYGCGTVSVGLIFPLFLSAGASLSGFDGPIELLACCTNV